MTEDGAGRETEAIVALPEDSMEGFVEEGNNGTAGAAPNVTRRGERLIVSGRGAHQDTGTMEDLHSKAHIQKRVTSAEKKRRRRRSTHWSRR